MYEYFDHSSNREYFRYKFSDTLFYFDAAQRGGGPEDSLVSTRIIPHADTILGRVCNRYVLRTKSMTLALSYDPTISIDPTWFAAARIAYYDVVYKAIRSVYLKMIWETKDFVVTEQATHVERRWVLSTEFPPVKSLPTAPIP